MSKIISIVIGIIAIYFVVKLAILFLPAIVIGLVIYGVLLYAMRDKSADLSKEDCPCGGNCRCPR